MPSILAVHHAQYARRSISFDKSKCEFAQNCEKYSDERTNQIIERNANSKNIPTATQISFSD